MLKKAQVESLRKLLETLRNRISEHESKLMASEALTRYALVDPLLRGMGWDIDDPAQVIPEYKLKDSRARKADYVLLGDDLDTHGYFPGTKRVLLIEAKSLSKTERDAREKLQDAAIQAESYSRFDQEVRYFAATDGRRWYIYDSHKPGGHIDDKEIASFDLGDWNAKKAINGCLQAEQLWRRIWHLEFVHGWRVDFDGKVRSPENGEVNNNFKKPRPSGTRWILRTDKRGKHEFLDAAGWVLTPKGNQSPRFDAPCPPDTAEIANRKFLDADGKEIGPKGRRR